ncbi:hypothetical protein B0H14DRAFT_2560674 [Mycena olivaceomarginata]|nr:hypothetical protein B0H14DRAFT_2560674 [Mycena olivaceomarginata]
MAYVVRTEEVLLALCGQEAQTLPPKHDLALVPAWIGLLDGCGFLHIQPGPPSHHLATLVASPLRLQQEALLDGVGFGIEAEAASMLQLGQRYVARAGIVEVQVVLLEGFLTRSALPTAMHDSKGWGRRWGNNSCALRVPEDKKSGDFRAWRARRQVISELAEKCNRLQ